MYYPYLRGKQFELITIREINLNVYNNPTKSVIPIIELESTTKRGIASSFESYVDNNIPFILIINPSIEGVNNSKANITNNIINGPLLNYDNYYIGFVIKQNTRLDMIEGFLNEFGNKKKSILHNVRVGYHADINNLLVNHNVHHNIFFNGRTDDTYPSNFTATINKVLIKDGFIRAQKNADYPTEDYFFNLHNTYVNDGYNGFGDYLTIGEIYRTGGGRAHAVALHLTYENNVNEIWIRHFISDDRVDRMRIPSKFLEALTHLITFVNRNPNVDITSGTGEFRNNFNIQNYPGLGAAKKMSMKHHIEFIHSLL